MELKEWARTIPVYENKDAWGNDHNASFVVDACNPGLTDIFLNQVRREQHLRTPLAEEEIQTDPPYAILKPVTHCFQAL